MLSINFEISSGTHGAIRAIFDVDILCPLLSEGRQPLGPLPHQRDIFWIAPPGDLGSGRHRGRRGRARCAAQRSVAPTARPGTCFRLFMDLAAMKDRRPSGHAACFPPFRTNSIHQVGPHSCCEARPSLQRVVRRRLLRARTATLRPIRGRADFLHPNCR